MLTFAVVAIFTILILCLGVYSRFLLSVVSIFALLNGWRLLSSSYLSNRGIVQAPELKRTLVSVFPVEIVMLLTLLIFLFSFLIFFNPLILSRFKDKLTLLIGAEKCKSLAIFFALFSIIYILFILVTAMVTAPLSQYPIFSGVHRRDFMLSYGSGEMIQIFFKTMTYASVVLGIGQIFFIEYFSFKKLVSWLPFVAWLTVFTFLIAQGHRFSTLLWELYFFYLPLSLLFLSKKSKTAESLFVSLATLFVISVFAMFTHSFVVGGFHATEKLSYIKQRVLVDQAQLWNLSATRVFGFNDIDQLQAEGTILDAFFSEDVYNRSAQFLMFKEMGSKAYESWEQSHIITMGFPESILDLVGEGAMFTWVLLLSVALCFFLYLFFNALVEFNLARCILYLYLMNPILYLFAGGTANAVFSRAYLGKCFLVLVLINTFWILEQALGKDYFYKRLSELNFPLTKFL